MTIKKYKRRFIILGVLLLVIALVIFARRGRPGVKLEPVLTQQELETLSLSGKLDAQEKVTLRFPTSGKLAWVGVKEGDYVQQYQGIAALDSAELQKRLERELKDYSISRWDFEQTKEDNKDRIVTNSLKRILEKSQFALDRAVIDVELVDLAKQLANLWTPIAGVVTRVSSPFAGANITPTQAEFDIVNPNSLYFSAAADQSDVVKLKEGAIGNLVLDSYPDLKFKGTVYSISFQPEFDETATVYEVKIKIEDSEPERILRLGMTGETNFTL